MKQDVMRALDYAIKKGFQIHPDVIGLLQEVEAQELDKVIKDVIREKAVNRDYHIGLGDMTNYLNLGVDDSLQSDHAILFDSTLGITTSGGVADYTALFKNRFEKTSKLMRDRPAAKKVKEAGDAGGVWTRMLTEDEKKKKAKKAADANKDKEDETYVWGLVTEKRIDGNVVKLTIEDLGGFLECSVTDDDQKTKAGDLFLDQFIMARVDVQRRKFVDIIQPDVPSHKPARSGSETFAVFMSDLHVGSRFFLEERLREFFKWLSSPDPYARRVRFVLIAGDIVDGIGMFPNQEKELVQQTTRQQFEKVAELLRIIPPYIKVFISPGNHDPGRRALPQPSIPKEDSPELWDMENVHMVGNPAMVSINGVKVLMFHGQSIDDIVKTTQGMEYNDPAKIMKQMIRSRHLSPIYGSQTPISPEKEDLMVIEEVPDVFHSGHVHVNGYEKYNGVMIINSGTWQGQTPFQESVGQVPTPCQAILLNLKTFKLFEKQF